MRDMNDGNDSQLKPASECIWYALATIAGEPRSSPNPNLTNEQNRHYWNGFLRSRGFSDDGASPQLAPEEIETIRETLFQQGYSLEQIPPANETIDFSDVKFPDLTCFEGFVFGGATTFEGARFEGLSHSFKSASFIGEVSFDSTEFAGILDGPSITFAGPVTFDRSKFSGNAIFDGSRFLERAVFDGAEFLVQASFDSCRFLGNATFRDTNFHTDVFFNSAKFETTVIFQSTKFSGTVPMFFESILPEYTEWRDSQWPKPPKRYDQALHHIQNYQRLAHLMNQLEKSDDQRMFVRLEMRARRRADGWSPAALMNLGYEAVCGYGYGLTRVLIIWLAHIVLGILALCAAKILKSPDEVTLWQATRDAFADVHLAFALSFANAHGPLGLGRTFFAQSSMDWPWQQVIGPVQTVLGVIILFFLLLTIRNRFRMR